MKEQNRQLAAILFTDIVGSTAMMQRDEQTAVSVNKRYVAVMKKFVSLHGGKILNDYGDGNLCSFSSASAAVRAAIDIQLQLQMEPQVPLRIGLHVGEIFFEDGKVMGDSVNVASRVQSLGQANTILFSKEVFDKLRNQSEYKSVSPGKFEFKNVDEPMEIFALALDGLVVPKRGEMTGKLKEMQRRSTKKKLIWIAAAILTIIAFYFIYRNLYNTSEFSGDKTIAVLPFENIGKENNEAYISDGITQDIINSLSRISSLKKVVGWFSVKGFKNTTKPMNVIANELGVAAILTGTLQKLGEKTRIVVELIEVGSQKRLWGDDYEYDNKNLLSIQSKIAEQIVDALKAGITPEEKKGLSKNYTENVEAYKFYLRGRDFWNKRGPVNFDSAETNYKRAIKLDPNYALAYAGIADCYTFNQKGMSQLLAIPIARGYANQALSLDSNLSEGLTSLGFIQHNFDYDWARSKRTLEKAIYLDPNNPIAHLYYGNVLQYTGNMEDGLKEVEKAVGLDPLAFGANWVLGRNYYFAGESDKAIEQFKKALPMAPTQLNQKTVAMSLALAYIENKMYPNAKEELDKIFNPVNDDGIDYYLLIRSYGYALMGNKTKAQELLEKAKEQGKGKLSPYRLSEVYVALGDYKLAFDELDKAYQTRDLHMFYIKVDPGFNSIKNQPRFNDLLTKMGLL